MERTDKIICHLREIHHQTQLVEYLGGVSVFSKRGFYTWIPF